MYRKTISLNLRRLKNKDNLDSVIRKKALLYAALFRVLQYFLLADCGHLEFQVEGLHELDKGIQFRGCF